MLRVLANDEISSVFGGNIIHYFDCFSGYQVKVTYNTVTGERTVDLTGQRCGDDNPQDMLP